MAKWARMVVAFVVCSTCMSTIATLIVPHGAPYGSWLGGELVGLMVDAGVVLVMASVLWAVGVFDGDAVGAS